MEYEAFSFHILFGFLHLCYIYVPMERTKAQNILNEGFIHIQKSMNKIGCIYVPPFLPLDFKYTIFGVFKFSLFIMVWINSTVFEDAKYLSKCRCVTPVCSFHCFNRLVALKNASLVLCSTTKPARGLFIIWFVIISFKVLFVHTLRNSFCMP